MTDTRDRLARLDTPAMSDALDRLGIDGQAVGIVALDRGAQLTGRAYTVRMLPRGLSGKSVGDYIDEVPAGDVVVIDNQGRLDATVWGDILTTVAHRDGIAGTVIDGVCRDVARAIGTGYPIYSKGRFMRTGKDRVEVSDTGRPVTVGGVQIAPGQLLVGDEDGVVAIPADVEDDLLDICAEIHEREAGIVADILAGGTLAAARARHGYHALQRSAS